VAAICLVALIWVNGRVGDLRVEAETTVGQLATTMDRTAKALHDASTTAGSFTGTIEQSALAVSSAAQTITEVRTGLSSLEAQLRAVNILGAQPLSATADAVRRIDASLEGLDTRLDTIATGLASNRDALERNATSLGQLGDSVDAMATRLDSGVIEDSLGDIQKVIVVVLLVFTAWSLVPAVGALVGGLWLRRELERSEPLDQAP
jgi:ABC-type transporter Mla subunit MlaD